jgi:tetratricopeptide (TPR) repeat protein
MRQRFASLGRALRAPEGVDVTKARDVAAVRELASRYRDSYPLQMAAGRALLAADDRAQAFTAFERAAELVPTAAGPDSPRALMAALAERSGDTARARRELQTLLAYDHTNVTASRALADLAEKAGDAGAQLLAYERITTIDPFDPVPHAALGRLARQRGDLRVAIREFQAAIAAGPVDIVSAQCDLGEALLLAGRKSDAKRAALAALEIAPTYERAQALLLRCIGGD